MSMAMFGAIKPVIRQLVPERSYQQLASSWRKRGWYEWWWRIWLKHGRPDRLLHFGDTPGDDLLCTAVLREACKRSLKRLWMLSRHPDLFAGNPDAHRVMPIGRHSEDYSLSRQYIQYAGNRFCPLSYSTYSPENDRAEPISRHAITELCGKAGVSGQIALRPYFHLAPAEKTAGEWAAGMIAIQSSNLAARHACQNKEWVPGRYQEVVDALCSRYQFVQLGAATDPLLKGVKDLRGQTGIRHSAGILFHCRSYIGGEGFLMHLARAVECPAVIVFGGRTAPWQFGYSCNENLYSPVPCAPCWYWNKCDHNRMCLDKITTGMVLEAVERQLGKARGPLAVDFAHI